MGTGLKLLVDSFIYSKKRRAEIFCMGVINYYLAVSDTTYRVEFINLPGITNIYNTGWGRKKTFSIEKGFVLFNNLLPCKRKPNQLECNDRIIPGLEDYTIPVHIDASFAARSMGIKIGFPLCRIHQRCKQDYACSVQDVYRTGCWWAV